MKTQPHAWNPLDPAEPAIGLRETSRANRALCDYLDLGHNRSLEKLIHTYIRNPAAPTRTLDTLKRWSATFAWNTRALTYDAIQRKKESQLYHERRSQIIESGLALRHERIEQLKNVYTQLAACLNQPGFIFHKQIVKLPNPAGGVDFHENNLINTALINQIRGLLNDIARETANPDPHSPYAPEEDTHMDLSDLTDQELDLLEKIYTKHPD